MPIDDPVVEVLGFTHTPLLGLVDIGMGLLLLAGGGRASRGLLTFLGLVAVVGRGGRRSPNPPSCRIVSPSSGRSAGSG